jgi:hypothetical protein
MKNNEEIFFEYVQDEATVCDKHSSKKEYDFTTGIGFLITNLVYDRKANAIFKYTVYNDDFSNKKKVDLFMPPVNNDIAFWNLLEAYQLVESYEKGELKG